MRLTLANLGEAAISAGVVLIAGAAIGAAELLIDHDSPFRPAIWSAIAMAAWIILVRRYGPREPVDPRRQRIRLLVSMVACLTLAMLGATLAFLMARHVG
jgi:hypothetical protein